MESRPRRSLGARSVMRNHHPIKIQHLRDELFAPKNLDHVPAIKWGVDHEPVAIDAYHKATGRIVRPTGVWMFHNNLMGASPDGLVFSDPHATSAVGILEVKCPYSMRDVKIECVSEWHHHLPYLDCRNELKTTHDYYHQIQGAMAPVLVDWCDFVIWKPSKMKNQRIPRVHGWSLRYIPRLETVFKHQLLHKEDFEDGESEMAPMDTDEERYDPYDYPARDLTSILHPIGPAPQYLRHTVTQCLHVHLSRWSYQMQSNSRSGHNWRKSVDKFWDLAIERICEDCIPKIFPQKDQNELIHRDLLDECNDIMINILTEHSLWPTLLFDPNFASMLKARVRSWEPTVDMRLTPCSCNVTGTTSLRYPRPTLHQSTFVMPPLSNAGYVPN